MLLLKLKLFAHWGWVWQIYCFLFHKPSSGGAQAIWCRSEYLPRSLYNIWKKKRINEIWSSPNIPFLHSRVKLVQVNLSLKNIKRNKLMSKQNVKSDQNLCFDVKVSIINIHSQTLFCNFIFGVLNFFFFFDWF